MLSIKGSEARKQWQYELLWMLWFEEKSISNEGTISQNIFWNLTALNRFDAYDRIDSNKNFRQLCDGIIFTKPWP